MMDLDEQTLLHEPDLMLAILRVAAKGEGTLDACVAHLRELLRLAEEDLPHDEQALREHLDHARKRLQQARLIEPINGERFRITRRGRSVLVENPHGVDDTILMQFEEFRSAVAPEVDRPTSPPAPRPADYERGYGAYVAGLGLADNPYPADSAGHLEWENGWSQARDDAQAHAGAAPLKPTAP